MRHSEPMDPDPDLKLFGNAEFGSVCNEYRTVRVH
jgi:hypothetical protein